jgi:FkbM family methyltransferase
MNENVHETDIRAIVDHALHGARSPSAAAQRFLSSGRHRYAIGKSFDTLGVHRQFKLDGIIDDFNERDDEWHGIPIVRTTDVPLDAWIVNCSTSISPVAVARHLERSGLKNSVGLHELVVAAEGRLEWPWFVRRQREEMREHLLAWTEIYRSLQDPVSRQTFVDVLGFRLSANPACMQNYVVRTEDQYFEAFMQFHEEVLVDAGGYDGDTTQAFADRYPDYRKILLFEPSSHNMLAAKNRLTGYRDIDFFPIGLSDTAGTVRFNPDGGSASAITASGGVEIPVDTLDATIYAPVSTIKMDLEGWEVRALHGARRHLVEDHPKLAIAVYHDAADFRLVHQFVTSIHPDYRCRLRHYTQGWSETIMYFTA